MQLAKTASTEYVTVDLVFTSVSVKSVLKRPTKNASKKNVKGNLEDCCRLLQLWVRYEI